MTVRTAIEVRIHRPTVRMTRRPTVLTPSLEARARRAPEDRAASRPPTLARCRGAQRARPPAGGYARSTAALHARLPAPARARPAPRLRGPHYRAPGRPR